ncbi:MAG TPA: hypothetical protein VG346_08760 [Acidimicrobiales bacterium]|nr:hypothetical protein [Acidimicrobiales bacterium]
MPADRSPATNGSGWRDTSQSRFFCNVPRKVSLLFGLLAFAALVIGGGFAEISSNGAPTSLETAIVRWIIVGSLVTGVVFYVIGGRLRAQRQGGR